MQMSAVECLMEIHSTNAGPINYRPVMVTLADHMINFEHIKDINHSRYECCKLNGLGISFFIIEVEFQDSPFKPIKNLCLKRLG